MVNQCDGLKLVRYKCSFHCVGIMSYFFSSLGDWQLLHTFIGGSNWAGTLGHIDPKTGIAIVFAFYSLGILNFTKCVENLSVPFIPICGK